MLDFFGLWREATSSLLRYIATHVRFIQLLLCCYRWNCITRLLTFGIYNWLGLVPGKENSVNLNFKNSWKQLHQSLNFIGIQIYFGVITFSTSLKWSFWSNLVMLKPPSFIDIALTGLSYEFLKMFVESLSDKYRRYILKSYYS